MAHFAGEVASGAFEAALRNAHDVVAWHDFLCAVVAHREDGAATGCFHLGVRGAGEGEEGVGRDVDGAEVLRARGGDELAHLQEVALSEGDGVNDKVEALEVFGVGVEDCGDVFVFTCVEGAEPGVFDAHGVDGALGAMFVALTWEVCEGTGCAVIGETLGDMPGVGTLVCDANDDAGFTCEE